MGLQPGCMRLQPGHVGLQPGHVGLHPGCVKLQPLVHPATGERTVHQPVSGLLRRGDSVFLYVHENVVGVSVSKYVTCLLRTLLAYWVSQRRDEGLHTTHYTIHMP